MTENQIKRAEMIRHMAWLQEMIKSPSVDLEQQILYMNAYEVAENRVRLLDYEIEHEVNVRETTELLKKAGVILWSRN